MIDAYLIEAYRDRAFMLDAINEVSPWHFLHRVMTARRLAKLIPTGKVLDIAAGTGLTGRELAARGCNVTMIDALPEMCKLANRAISNESRERVKIICSDIASFKNDEPSTFDAVVCTQALNFFSRPADVFRAAVTALKPGGVFYFDIDSAFRWTIIEALSGHISNAKAIAESGEDIERNVVGSRYFFHSIEALQKLLYIHGFSSINVSGILYAVPFLHLFHVSADFLEPDCLHPSVKSLVGKNSLEGLLELEETLSRLWSPESAGYQVFVSVKEIQQ